MQSGDPAGHGARVVVLFLLAATPLAQQFLPREHVPPIPGMPHRVHAFDVDRDGDLDLFVTNLTGQPDRLLRNDGNGRFTDMSAQLPPGGDWCRDVAFGDVDRDRRVDLVLAKGPDCRLYLGSATGFTDATSNLPVVGNYPNAVTLADVDGDADLDLFVGAYPNLLFRNDGQGRFRNDGPAAANVHGPEEVARAADLDRDGDVDFVVPALGPLSNFHVAIFRNDGTGRFAHESLGASGDRVDDLDLADLDGDGDPDIVLIVQRLNAGSLLLAFNDGNAVFRYTSAVVPDVLQRPYNVSCADLDEDGDSDLVVAGMDNGSLFTIVYRQGPGLRFAATGETYVDHRNPCLADLDGDGDTDVVALHATRPPQSLLNRHRQLDAPALARIGQPWVLDVHDRADYASSFSVAVPFVSEFATVMAVPPLGTLRLDPAKVFQLPPLVIPARSPQPFAVPIPNAPELVGRTLHAQAVLVIPLGEVRLTNAVQGLVQ